jgi:hypothetical protein
MRIEISWREVDRVMGALARVAAELLERVRPADTAPAAAEPAYAQPRPMRGLFASLSPEQQGRVLAYQGPDSHGDPAFKLK